MQVVITFLSTSLANSWLLPPACQACTPSLLEQPTHKENSPHPSAPGHPCHRFLPPRTVHHQSTFCMAIQKCIYTSQIKLGPQAKVAQPLGGVGEPPLDRTVWPLHNLPYNSFYSLVRCNIRAGSSYQR